nr:MAG TPA: hypothetical protein [Caudoviricetes sp.]
MLQLISECGKSFRSSAYRIGYNIFDRINPIGDSFSRISDITL